ncbi:MAG: lasso RiPP family leader peptide-containing protein [Actinobacteria bacterium]|nr:lasso RiPP family leader peptide-containing protein [Actinomycetota bacterium]
MDYQPPQITDYGTLIELTAGSATGNSTDKLFNPLTPRSQLTFT